MAKVLARPNLTIAGFERLLTLRYALLLVYLVNVLDTRLILKNGEEAMSKILEKIIWKN